jgi:hypothetical protein
MRIQDTFHPDGIPYESGEEFYETESEFRLSQEKLDGDTSPSPSASTNDQSGRLFILSLQIYSNFF